MTDEDLVFAAGAAHRAFVHFKPDAHETFMQNQLRLWISVARAVVDELETSATSWPSRRKAA